MAENIMLDRKNSILAILTELLKSRLPDPDNKETEVKNLYITRKNEPSGCSHLFGESTAILVCQGKKVVNYGRGPVTLERGTLMVSCVDSPYISQILEATPAKPFLAVYFTLNRLIFTELLSLISSSTNIMPNAGSNAAYSAPQDFLETILRLTEISDDSQSASILGPLLMRELHYLLLTGPSGQSLKDLYMRGTKDSRIIDIISWLKNNLNCSISIEELAKRANMSISSLHRHFKNITGFSPLQYHKELRLLEAQRLMLSSNERADIAALTVGYESVTQFNREYKRKFGLPPHRDIVRIKNGFSN